MIRLADERDAVAVQAIYAPYVRETAISFETEPPPVEEIAGRMRAVLAHAPWLVCEREGRVVAYAYAGRFHARAAYQWSVEVTVYADRMHHRRGVGRALYTALLDVLRVQGFCTAVGIVALPNPPSVGLHEALGFERVGVIPAVGFKHGRWHDVGWWRLALRSFDQAPEPPRPLAAVVGTNEWNDVLAGADRLPVPPARG